MFQVYLGQVPTPPENFDVTQAREYLETTWFNPVATLVFTVVPGTLLVVFAIKRIFK